MDQIITTTPRIEWILKSGSRVPRTRPNIPIRTRAISVAWDLRAVAQTQKLGQGARRLLQGIKRKCNNEPRYHPPGVPIEEYCQAAIYDLSDKDIMTGAIIVEDPSRWHIWDGFCYNMPTFPIIGCYRGEGSVLIYDRCR